MKIAIFGSACDPPHNGHAKIMRDLKTLVDEVWFMPCAGHMFDKKMQPMVHRGAMAKILAVEEEVQLCTFQLDTGIRPTYPTLLELQKKYPEHEFSFVIGYDNFLLMKMWFEWEQLVSNFECFVYDRHIQTLSDEERAEEKKQIQNLLSYCKKVTFRESVLSISSTIIRDKVSSGSSVRGLISDYVLDYIIKHDLYKSKPL